MQRTLVFSALVALAPIVGTACGADDSEATGDNTAYCELAAELEAAGEPTEGQLDEVVAAAPEEIRDDVEAFVDAARTGNFSADIEDREQAIMSWEAEHCGDTFGGEQETEE